MEKVKLNFFSYSSLSLSCSGVQKKFTEKQKQKLNELTVKVDVIQLPSFKTVSTDSKFH